MSWNKSPMCYTGVTYLQSWNCWTWNVSCRRTWGGRGSRGGCPSGGDSGFRVPLSCDRSLRRHTSVQAMICKRFLQLLVACSLLPSTSFACSRTGGPPRALSGSGFPGNNVGWKISRRDCTCTVELLNKWRVSDMKRGESSHQIVHSDLFAPVWVLVCLFKSNVSLKPFPQKVQR